MIPNPNISFQNVINTLPKSNLQLTPQLAENLRAIFSPNEVLAEKQQQLIAQISQFKTQELSGAIATKAAGDIDTYRSDAMNMLKSNKGQKRLNFTPEQQAELMSKRRILEQDINYGMGQLKTFDNTLNKAMQMMKEGMLSEDDIKQVVGWSDRVKKTLSEGKSIADIPDHQAELAQLLSSKPQKEIQLRQAITIWDKLISNVQGRYFEVPKEEIISNLNTQAPAGSEAWKQLRAMHESMGQVSTTDSDEQARNKVHEILFSRYRDKYLPSGSGSGKDDILIQKERGGEWNVAVEGGIPFVGEINGTAIDNGKVSKIYQKDDGEYMMEVVYKTGSSMFDTGKVVKVDTPLTNNIVAVLKKKRYVLEGFGESDKTEKKEQPKETITNHKDNPYG